MMFRALVSLTLSAVLVAANAVTFVSLDGIHRTIYFTASVPHPYVHQVRVPAYDTVTVDMPWSWIGNWYSVSDGKPNVPGMLGEVTFQGWNDLTYFDVSAIVNPDDHEGVKEMFPEMSDDYRSGCNPFPCNNAYYLPDDVQTKTTEETDLVCTLGRGYIAKRDEVAPRENVARRFVTGEEKQ